MKLMLKIVAYFTLACWTTWPAITQIGRSVPGAQRSDIWNSLWSLWFFQHNLQQEGFTAHTQLISHPHGGVLMVADPLNAILAAPLIPVIGLPASYTLLVLFQLTLAGLAAHTFAEELLEDARGRWPEGAGWIAGFAFATAAVLRSGVHNGTSESFAGGWTALAVWLSWRAAKRGGIGRILLAVLAVTVGALASFYSAVVIFLFLGALVLLPPGQRWLERLGSRVLVLVLSLMVVAPLALSIRSLSDHPKNLVAIKTDREMMGIRRSTGPADLVGYFAPGNYRSPDFQTLSRYGEAFFHCHSL